MCWPMTAACASGNKQKTPPPSLQIFILLSSYPHGTIFFPMILNLLIHIYMHEVILNVGSYSLGLWNLVKKPKNKDALYLKKLSYCKCVKSIPRRVLLPPDSLFGRLGYSNATENLTPSQATDNTRLKGRDDDFPSDS